jgi:hypothetical protein
MPAVFNVMGSFALHHAAEQLGRHSGSTLFVASRLSRGSFLNAELIDFIKSYE